MSGLGPEQAPSGGLEAGVRARRPRASVLAALVGLGALTVVGSVLLETSLLRPYPVPLDTSFRILLHALSGGWLFTDPCAGAFVGPAGCSGATFIVVQIALPEVVLALLVGAALGVSGGALQGVFRNPLADPFLLGISSGGTLGAAVIYVYRFGEGHADLYLPAFAFLGSVATGLLIFGIARGRASSVETTLLAGVAVANLLSAVLSLVLLYNPFGAEQVTFWLLGSLALASWTVDGIVVAGVFVLATALTAYGRDLNLLQLGGEVAQSAGVDTRRVRFTVILLASLLTAVAVAFAGIIGFVGLVAPHIVRRLAGSDYRRVLPGSAVVGALLLLGANDASVVAFPSSYLPLGIFTAFAGVPFFLALLLRQRRAATMEAL